MRYRVDRYREYREFLQGGPQTRPFACLDPSSFASVYAGKQGGYPSLEDQIAFHLAFPSDAAVNIPVDFGAVIPELRWERRFIRDDSDGSMFYEEKISTPEGEKRRVVADRFGTTSWLIEPAVRSPDDFALIHFYAEHIEDNAQGLAASIAHIPPMLREKGLQPGTTILSAFEVQYLIDYADMPLFFMDWDEAYIACTEKIHSANLALLRAMAGVGVEMFFTGSAGLELLSPSIFRSGIIPYQREFNDLARSLGVFSNYHVCGHSRGMIEQGIVDAIKPTIFETCSGPPCGNNDDLRASIGRVDEEIITKGNINLELLRDGSPAEIAEAVRKIHRCAQGRRHIIGQADATILAGTPVENINAFLDTICTLEMGQEME